MMKRSFTILSIVFSAAAGLTACGSHPGASVDKSQPSSKQLEVYQTNVQGDPLVCVRDNGYDSISCNWEAWNKVRPAK
ncbi:hypothetical protein GCM10023063_16010 [Arthrobacter methylotrophus]|uniref:Lipoprotein n=1 Tax=Arthrobacter methylotrophus TaxID=121291 RepID=A0ABV5UND4_9MICC